MGQWRGCDGDGGPLWRSHVCWLVSHSQVICFSKYTQCTSDPCIEHNHMKHSNIPSSYIYNNTRHFVLHMHESNPMHKWSTGSAALQVFFPAHITMKLQNYHISPCSSFFRHNMSTPSITAHGSLAWWWCVNIHTRTTLIRWQPSARGWHRVTSPWLTPPGIFIFPQIAFIFSCSTSQQMDVLGKLQIIMPVWGAGRETESARE